LIKTKATWEKQKPQIISGCEKLQIVAGLNILFTILYAFYSRKFSLYNLASIYGCVEFSRACSTLKKHLVKYEALYSYVNKGSLTDQDDKNTLTSLENHFLMALKADLIGKSLIMSLMDP
jgi:hypothetical protein